MGEALAYGHDAAVWARGILADEYGVPIDSVTYVTGALDPIRRRDFNPFTPPKHIKVEPVPGVLSFPAQSPSKILLDFYILPVLWKGRS